MGSATESRRSPNTRASTTAADRRPARKPVSLPAQCAEFCHSGPGLLKILDLTIARISAPFHPGHTSRPGKPDTTARQPLGDHLDRCFVRTALVAQRQERHRRLR